MYNELSSTFQKFDAFPFSYRCPSALHSQIVGTPIRPLGFLSCLSKTAIMPLFPPPEIRGSLSDWNRLLPFGHEKRGGSHGAAARLRFSLPAETQRVTGTPSAYPRIFPRHRLSSLLPLLYLQYSTPPAAIGEETLNTRKRFLEDAVSRDTRC